MCDDYTGHAPVLNARKLGGCRGRHSQKPRSFTRTNRGRSMRLLDVLAFLSLAIVIVLLLLVLFEPPLRYKVRAPVVPLDSEDFLRLISALADAQLYRN